MVIGGAILSGVIYLQDSLVLAQDCPDELCDGPSPSPVVKTLDLGKDGPNCGQNHFYVNAVAKINGVTQKGVEVTFEYKGVRVKKKTDSTGRAETDIEFKGDDQVKAKASGYPSQKMGVSSRRKVNCEEKVEVTKLAETGMDKEMLVDLSFMLGAAMVGMGVLVYVKQN